jgi:hypothetical protein
MDNDSESRIENQPADAVVVADHSRSIEARTVEDVMEDSYLRYSMSVIVARALPDVRDGMKPVHRRILYVMDKMGIRPTGKTVKSAQIVGEVMGKYHPHGDTPFMTQWCAWHSRGRCGTCSSMGRVTSAQWTAIRRLLIVIPKQKWAD